MTPEVETFDHLVKEYSLFCQFIGFELGSADEHLCDLRLTPDERAWLRVFCRRWDAMERRDRRRVTESVVGNGESS